MSDTRSIRLAVEVPGTAQEAWAAIATAAGISSWYVPHTLEERQGGMATARFGAGDEMLVPGRVAAWEPPRRIVFDGGEASGSAMTFQWTVQPVGDDRCEIELLNEGYGSGGEWDDQFAAMHDGWEMFLTNLRLHMENFRGRTAAPARSGGRGAHAVRARVPVSVARARHARPRRESSSRIRQRSPRRAHDRHAVRKGYASGCPNRRSKRGWRR